MTRVALKNNNAFKIKYLIIFLKSIFLNYQEKNQKNYPHIHVPRTTMKKLQGGKQKR